MGWLGKLLAHTIYNPEVNAPVEWVNAGPAELEKIKKAILNGIAEGNDTLLQFITEMQIKSILEAAKDFQQLVLAIQCINGKHESDKK